MPYLPRRVRSAHFLSKKHRTMTASERTPLLDGHVNGGEPTSLGHKLKAFVIAEGEPSWAHSLKFLFLGSWFNLFLIFIPLGFISHHLDWDAGLRFAFNFFAIMPLAKVRNQLHPPVRKRSTSLNITLVIATRRIHRATLYEMWPDSRRTPQRQFRQCCRNHCWCRRPLARYVLPFPDGHAASGLNCGWLTLPFAKASFGSCRPL